ncbi:MAG: alpha/beta hydrolase-fold protein [Clostridia bacterium]|nr:alpha/beta hydrolase-fold protein [Clostridia bacterium]
MLEKFTLPYPAYTGEEERTVYVYLPDAFETDDQIRYPVLYMFDGHNVFLDEDATYGKSWGLGDYLHAHEIPLAVVAVECNHSPDGGRLSEYAPYSFQAPGLGRVTGRGQETMRWFIKTLKPLIDHQYPVRRDRNHTWIAGSSMGGLMSLYAVLEYNHVFSRAAALSPSIWFAAKKMDDLIARSRVRPDTVIYMDYGQREMTYRSNMMGRFSRVCNQLLEKGALLTSRIVPAGEHCEASWEKQIPFFINTLLYGVRR